jgi:exodeoxyribonuclease VII small subunit
MKDNTTYAEAFEELKNLVSELDKGDVSVDDLSVKVKRAAILIKICKEKLYSTEADVNAILNELDEQ